MEKSSRAVAESYITVLADVVREWQAGKVTDEEFKGFMETYRKMVDTRDELSDLIRECPDRPKPTDSLPPR